MNDNIYRHLRDWGLILYGIATALSQEPTLGPVAVIAAKVAGVLALIGVAGKNRADGKNL